MQFPVPLTAGRGLTGQGDSDLAHDTTTTDLAVIGGGVIGLSCALQIRAKFPDCSITIVDAPNRPGVASRAAAGMLVPLAEFHDDSPLFRLGIESYCQWPQFLAEYGGSSAPEIDSTGALVPSGHDEALRGELAARFARLHSPEVASLTASDVRALEPLLDGDVWDCAYKIEGAVVDPRRVHEALTAEATCRSIAFHPGEVVEVELAGSPNVARALKLADGGRIEFERLLLSTGAWSQSIGEKLGLSVELIPIKGQVARLAAPDGALRHVVHTTPIYFAPRAGEGILIGATMEDAGFDPTVTEAAMNDLRRMAQAFSTRISELPLAESWMGFRPKFPDGAPAIGWSSRVSNLLVATGHFRNGILLTPATGRLIAECFGTGANAPGSAFDPTRLGI